jgi:phosphoglycolate phosphatase
VSPRGNGSRPALLFDLDGCIVDSLPSIVRCWSAILPEFGLPTPAASEIRPFVGPPVSLAARHFAPGRDDATIEAIVAAYRRLSAQAQDIEPYPGIRELLASLGERGVVLGIATSKSIEVAQPLLRHLELAAAFAVIEGTRVDELGTDKVTIVGRALARLAPVRPAALIGDREHDVRGAHANGLRAIGALWGYGSESELAAAGADVLVRTPSELAREVLDLGGDPAGLGAVLPDRR